MAVVDNDPKIRELFRSLWEEDGRPSGREHIYWAQASKTFEREADKTARQLRSVAR